MHTISIDASRCAGEGLCAAVCARHILTSEKRGLPRVDSPEDCNLCGHCVAICPHGAIEHSGLQLADFPSRPRDLGIPADRLTLLLRSRRSVREWRDRPVPREVVEQLIDAARYAPTGSNAQGVEYTVVQDRDRLRHVEDLIFEGMRPRFHPDSAQVLPRFWRRRISEYEAGARNLFMRDAPALVVLHAPVARDVGDEDCHYSAMHMVLLAEMLGLGTCFLGLLTIVSRTNEAIKTALQIPADHRIGTALTLGYPRYRYHRLLPRNPPPVTWL